MKLLISILITFGSTTGFCYILDAKPVQSMIEEIKGSEFRHIENGLAFGFNSIKSCLYASKDFTILKNYCVPAKEYPAQGFTIFSQKYGVIDLYQEKQPLNMLKRDIQITAFSDMLNDFINTPLKDSQLAEINELSQALYEVYGPACWSTNARYEDGQAEVGCNSKEVMNFKEWSSETQKILLDEKSWKSLMTTIESSLPNQ